MNNRLSARALLILARHYSRNRNSEAAREMREKLEALLQLESEYQDANQLIEPGAIFEDIRVQLESEYQDADRLVELDAIFENVRAISPPELVQELRGLNWSGYFDSDDSVLNSEPVSGSNAAADQAIREIVNMVKDDIKEGEIIKIYEMIERHDLDPADIIKALDNEIKRGDPLTPSEAHEDQDLGFNCASALTKVVMAQHGIHAPEGVVTLRALLDGTLNSIPPGKLCFELLFGIIRFCTELDLSGTLPLQMSLFFEREGLPVHYDYSADLSTLKAEIALGHSVMVGVEVSPLWGQPGAHISPSTSY